MVILMLWLGASGWEYVAPTLQGSGRHSGPVSYPGALLKLGGQRTWALEPVLLTHDIRVRSQAHQSPSQRPRLDSGASASFPAPVR